MTDLRLAAETISGLTSRRQHALSTVVKVLGLSHDQLDPATDWNSFMVSSYLGSRPFCLYFEPAFTNYYRHLVNTYGTNLGLFASDFNSCGHDLWKAINTAERIATEIESEDLDQLGPYEAVTRCLNQWYLRLVEQAFDSLLGFTIYRLHKSVGKQPPVKSRNIYEAMTKQSWHGVGNFYYPTVRNGIAHDFEFLQESVLSPVSVNYIDSKGDEQTLTFLELVDAVSGISDECLAYAFALRLFIFEHAGNSNVDRLLKATPSNRQAREQGFKILASSRSLVVESLCTDTVNGKKQIRIECLDYCHIEQERIAEIVAILISAKAWFPDADAFLVGLKSKRPISFARIEARLLTSWLSEEIDDRQFLESFDPLLVWPGRVWLGRLRANLARTLPAVLESGRKELKQAKADLPGQLPAAVRVLSLSDISHVLARRYRGDFLVDVEDQDSVRRLLRPLMEWIKRQRIHHSSQSKEHWGRTPPTYVAGFLYSREKRERDRGAFPTSDYYIGQFEWRSPGNDEESLPPPIRDAEDLGQGLMYKPAAWWPPADRFIPR